jgi:hypothetical protein
MAYRLWPRSIAPPPYTEQDRRALQLYRSPVPAEGNEITVSTEAHPSIVIRHGRHFTPLRHTAVALLSLHSAPGAVIDMTGTVP